MSTFEPDFHASFVKRAEMTGKMAPDFTLSGADGKPVTLSAYRGKPVLLDLWATWCGPCLAAMPAFNRIYTDAKDRGLTVISADEDAAPATAADYLARHHYGWTNYHDPGGKAEKALQADAIPLMILVDAQGKIVYYDIGSDAAALRKAIAGLGPQFASFANPGAEPATAQSSSGR